MGQRQLFCKVPAQLAVPATFGLEAAPVLVFQRFRCAQFCSYAVCK